MNKQSIYPEDWKQTRGFYSPAIKIPAAVVCESVGPIIKGLFCEMNT